MKSNLDFARGLAQRAEDDLKMAQIGLQLEAALETVCFHLQQAAEKFLKAALVTRDVDYPFTHDLERLLRLATEEFPALAPFQGRLTGFSRYAVDMRYDASIVASREETLAGRETVQDLRPATGCRFSWRPLPPWRLCTPHDPRSTIHDPPSARTAAGSSTV